MMDVYYPNAIFMLCPLIESLVGYWQFAASQTVEPPRILRLLGSTWRSAPAWPSDSCLR